MGLDDETEMESEPEIDDFPLLTFISPQKRTIEMLGTEDSQNTYLIQKEDVPTQNSTLMKCQRSTKPHGTIEEMESLCPGAESGFLARLDLQLH